MRDSFVAKLIIVRKFHIRNLCTGFATGPHDDVNVNNIGKVTEILGSPGPIASVVIQFLENVWHRARVESAVIRKRKSVAVYKVANVL